MYKKYSHVRCNLVVQMLIANFLQDESRSDRQDDKVKLMPILTP